VRTYSERCIGVELRVRQHAGQHGRDRDVEARADDERADDADRNVAARVLDLLAKVRNYLEANVGEEHQRRAVEDALHAERKEVAPVRRRDLEAAEHDHQQNGGERHAGDDEVEPRGLPDAEQHVECQK